MAVIGINDVIRGPMLNSAKVWSTCDDQMTHNFYYSWALSHGYSHEVKFTESLCP